MAKSACQRQRHQRASACLTGLNLAAFPAELTSCRALRLVELASILRHAAVFPTDVLLGRKLARGRLGTLLTNNPFSRLLSVCHSSVTRSREYGSRSVLRPRSLSD